MYRQRFTRLVFAFVVFVSFVGNHRASAHDETCVWKGEKSSDWFDKDNWTECDNSVPAAHDDVRIGGAPRFPVIDSRRSDVVVENLTLQSEIYIDVSRKLTVKGELRAESGARISNDGTVDGRLVVMPGTVEARGYYDGPITVAPFGTLKVPDRSLLVANDDLTVNGTLSSPLSSVTFSGTTFTNNGAVTANLLFRSTLPQTIRGTGTWTSPIVAIGNGTATRVSLANSVTLAVGRLGMSHASVLDIGTHTLTVKGPSAVNTGGGSRINGDGIIRTEGAVTISNGSGIAPALEVTNGTTVAGGVGTFEGPVNVAVGTTLSVPSGGLLKVANNLTVRGTLTGPGPSLIFTGTTFVNDGAISVPRVFFGGTEQALRGTGFFSTANTAFVERDTRLTLGSDHRMNIVNVRLRGTLDLTGRTLTLTGSGAALLRFGTVVTTQSTISFNGTAAQRVATNVDYHNLLIDNTAGVGTEAGTLKVQALLRTKQGTFTTGGCTCHDVQIDAGAALATGQNSLWSVTGNWTNKGVFEAGTGNTVAFLGSGPQRIAGTTATTFNNLTLAESSATTMEVDARVEATLTLHGDLRTGRHVLVMPKEAQSAGGGDVWGTVRRTGPFTAGTTYASGSPWTSLTFDAAGTLPSEITVRLTEGEPTALAPAVDRRYEISQQGGRDWKATLRLHYRDAELNTRRESDLQPWRFDPVQGRWVEQPRTAANITDNWVECAGVTAFGQWALTTRYKMYTPLLIR